MLRALLERHDALLAARLAALDPSLGASLAELGSLARPAGVGLVDLLLARGLLDPSLLARARSLEAGAGPRGEWRGHVVLGELGRGAHGIVLLARRSSSERLALKVLRPIPGGPALANDAARFDREARLLARLDHPGIARLALAGEEDGLRFLATEAASGPPLSERGALPPRAALELGVRVAHALAHAHAQGVVHRDLKPSNVLLDARGPVVVDFGLAKDLASDSRATASHALLGTVAYAAPEQLAIAGKIDPSADVYALAGVVHFALAGRPPFGEPRSLGEHFGRIRRGFGSLGPVPGLPPDEVAVVDAVLALALGAAPAGRSSLASLADGLAYAASRLPA